MGGEKNKELEGVWLPIGSPPRRRGKVVHCAAVRALRGITPRVGGEKLTSGVFSSAEDGSPPHGRGKELFNLLHVLRHRITPAQAGKSKLALCTPSCPTDHPCAGGEKNKELEGVWLPMGSPPRGRGKVDFRSPFGLYYRITPA